MTAKKRWTKEEEEILVQAIKANPHNLEKAFKIVAEEIGRTKAAVHIKWYADVKSKSLCFTTISEHKMLKNGKCIPNNSIKPLEAPVSLWQKLKNLFK
jgi:hypothetical protein